jgi:hypothetical protein
MVIVYLRPRMRCVGVQLVDLLVLTSSCAPTRVDVTRGTCHADGSVLHAMFVTCVSASLVCMQEVLRCHEVCSKIASSRVHVHHLIHLVCACL